MFRPENTKQTKTNDSFPCSLEAASLWGFDDCPLHWENTTAVDVQYDSQPSILRFYSSLSASVNLTGIILVLLLTEVVSYDCVKGVSMSPDSFQPSCVLFASLSGVVAPH